MVFAAGVQSVDAKFKGLKFWKSTYILPDHNETLAEAATAAVEMDTKAQAVAAAVTVVVAAMILGYVLISKSPKEKKAALKQAEKTKKEESLTKIAAQAYTEKQVDPTPVKIDNVQIQLSKNKAVSAMRKNAAQVPGGVLPSVGTVSGDINALAASKPRVS